MEDNKIIELYFMRNEDAISRTKDIYGARLKALAFNILRNIQDAEECENDTYIKAWESIPPQKPQHFFAYLAKICRNSALKILEKQKAEKRNAVIVELSQELSECLPDRYSLSESPGASSLLSSSIGTYSTNTTALQPRSERPRIKESEDTSFKLSVVTVTEAPEISPFFWNASMLPIRCS